MSKNYGGAANCAGGQKFKGAVTVGFCVLFMLLAFLDVRKFAESARGGMVLFGTTVLPILFPFLFVCTIIIDLVGARRGWVLVPLHFALSVLTGAPTSARMISQITCGKSISRRSGLVMASYTTTASPIFVIASLGASLYGDLRLGVLIFVSTILGALLNGVLYWFLVTRVGWVSRALGEEKCALPVPAAPPRDISMVISGAMYTAVKNVLTVGGFIVIFFVVSANLPALLSYVTEMTTGVFVAERFVSGIWRAVVPTAIISFGGVCLAMQNFVFLRDLNTPVWYYVMYKVTHAVFAVAVCAALWGLFNI